MGNYTFEVSQGSLNTMSGIREAQLQNLKHVLISCKYCAQKYLKRWNSHLSSEKVFCLNGRKKLCEQSSEFFLVFLQNCSFTAN